MEFVLIRHTACEIAPGVCYGHLDVPLCASSDADAERTLRNVPGADLIFTSPSQRCLLLARRLAQRDGSRLAELDELRELNFGAWEGLHWARIPRALSDEWAENPWERAPPGGETEAALFERVARAHRVALDQNANRIAIVAHAGPLRLLRCLILGTPLADRWQWTIAPGEVATFAM